jgi:hypothetical protein
MDEYKLLNLDQMEATLVRRRLRQWSKVVEQAIAPLIADLEQRQCLPNVHITKPRYVTNVYPLYYYWAHGQQLSHREVYDRVFRSLPVHNIPIPEEQLRPHVARLVDCEIDILVEDIDYFIFIEAKEAVPGHKIKFENKGGVHQLVRQYVQGRILQQLISKPFALATIGANNGQMLELKLNSIECALLQLVYEDKVILPVADISWPPPAAVAKSSE